MAAADRLVWIDCEMTGLDLGIDELVEVAVVVTDFDLKPLDPGFDIVIKPSDAALAQMGDVVRTMHTTSGLLEELAHGVSLADAEARVLEYLQRFTSAGSAPIAGNTIGTDRSFLVRWMPQVDAHLHYRSIDVSSIKELVKRWFPRVYYNAPAKNGGHRALADILESIRELDYYRRAAFVQEPGPTSEQAQAAATQVAMAFAQHGASGSAPAVQ
ncbi:MAG TPA: oligoribonuclease [Amnibacterium sp.]|jgi:oligoribonuclease|uniref:oligoribonuclease n=1 Tax=Amnibacterium sp. TaxID=1872496 RepID=UPI002F91CB2F